MAQKVSSDVLRKRVQSHLTYSHKRGNEDDVAKCELFLKEYKVATCSAERIKAARKYTRENDVDITITSGGKRLRATSHYNYVGGKSSLRVMKRPGAHSCESSGASAVPEHATPIQRKTLVASKFTQMRHRLWPGSSIKRRTSARDNEPLFGHQCEEPMVVAQTRKESNNQLVAFFEGRALTPNAADVMLSPCDDVVPDHRQKYPMKPCRRYREKTSQCAEYYGGSYGKVREIQEATSKPYVYAYGQIHIVTRPHIGQARILSATAKLVSGVMSAADTVYISTDPRCPLRPMVPKFVRK